MKINPRIVYPLSLMLLTTGLAGCASTRVIVPVGNGYEEVGHPTRATTSQPETARVSFQYREPDGRTVLIWPNLYGVNEVIKDKVAVFVGDKAYEKMDQDHPRTTRPRLFAVNASGPPLDITDEILWRWSRTSGKDFAKAVSLLSLETPAEENGRLAIHLVFWTDEKDWPDAVMRLDWNQVSDLMREVKAKGVVRKDPRWGSTYIEKELQPD